MTDESNVWAARRSANAASGNLFLGDSVAQDRLRFKKHDGVIVDRAQDTEITYYFPSAVGSALFYYGHFETGEISLCARILEDEKHPFIVDVGANVGTHSLAWARLLPAASVLAVEPAPANLELLRKNITAAGLDSRIAVTAAAVGAQSGTAEFVETDDAAYSALRDTGRRNVARRYEVALQTIDGLVEQSDLPRVSLIKIDVEGTEDDVLAGAASTLKRFKPHLFIEIYGGSASNPDPQRTIDTLLALGYEAFVISDGIATPFERHDDLFYNYLFVHKTRRVAMPLPDLALKRRIDAERLELLDKLTADLERDHSHVRSAQEHWGQLDAELLQKEERLLALSRGAQELQNQLVSAQAENDKLSAAAKALSAQLVQAAAENGTLGKSAAELRAQLEDSAAENARLLAAAREASNRSEALTQTASALQEQLRLKDAAIADLSGAAAELRSKLQASSRDATEKDAEIARLSSSAAGLRAQLEGKDAEVSNLLNHAADLGEQLAEKDAAIANLSNQAAELGGQLAEKDAAIANLSNQAADLGGQLAEKDAAITNLSNQAAELGGQLAEKDAAITSLSNHAAGLLEQLNEKDALITRLSGELEGISEQAALIRLQIDEKEQAIVSISEQAQTIREEAERRSIIINEMDELCKDRLEVIRKLNEELARLRS